MLSIGIGSSTYVGMITVDRVRQYEKAKSDMVTREVGRDRMVIKELPRRESYKRTTRVRNMQSIQTPPRQSRSTLT